MGAAEGWRQRSDLMRFTLEADLLAAGEPGRPVGKLWLWWSRTEGRGEGSGMQGAGGGGVTHAM